jgi:hypothetical protein
MNTTSCGLTAFLAASLHYFCPITFADSGQGPSTGEVRP